METLKQKYATIGEQYIREELIKWEINDSGEVTLIPRTFHAMGELSNKGISIALEAAIQEFDRQLDIDKVIKKLAKEGFFKDTGNVKGGVVVEYNNDGSVKRIVELSTDGQQKTLYQFSGPVSTMTRYNIVDGEEIRSYEEVEYNGTKIVSVYDSSGKNVYRQSTYVVNERTNRYELQYVDQWLVNERGEVIKDYKQISSPIAEIEMNPEYAQRRNHENNYFKQSGCLLTALAGVFDFYGNTKINTPEKIDGFVDENKLWLNGTAMINPERTIEFLGYDFKQNDRYNEFNKILQDNLVSNTPTIVHYTAGHFSLIAGARHDANGNITDYLMHDPGTTQSTGAYLPVKTLYNYRWDSSIDKIYWILKNQRR